MSKRSHFLAMLSQSGWDQIDLSASRGAARARVTRSGREVAIELWEGEKLLARMEGSGLIAREVVGSLRATEGLWVDMEGAQEAWAFGMEALVGMRAKTVGLSGSNAPGAPTFSGRKIGGARKAQKDAP